MRYKHLLWSILLILTFLIGVSSARELKIVAVGERRLAVSEVVDNRGEPQTAERLESQLIEAFTDGDPMRLLWSGEIETESVVTYPEVSMSFFAPLLEPAAENGAYAVLGCFLQPGDTWVMMLVGVSGRVLAERGFNGSYADAAPLITAAAVASFDEHFSPAANHESASGTLFVTCNAWGYGLSVDGINHGQLPSGGMELTLAPGEHRLVLLDPEGDAVETRFIRLPLDGLLTESFYVTVEDVDDYGQTSNEVIEEDSGFDFFGCLFDVLLAGLCSSGTNGDDDDDDDDGVW